MGWWSLAGRGPVIGVSLGAPIIATFGWRALFWFQLVLIVVAFVVVSIVLPKRRGLDHEEAEKKSRARREFKEMDWIGSWSLSIAVTASCSDSRSVQRWLDQRVVLATCSCSRW